MQQLVIRVSGVGYRVSGKDKHKLPLTRNPIPETRNPIVPIVLLLVSLATARADVYTTTRPSPDGIGKVYMGREIAQVMGHVGADWLERPERQQEERPDLALENLELKPTDVVADIGAGTGYYTFRMAPKVPQGKVLAVDIQQEMLDAIAATAKKQNIGNVEGVLGTIEDPKLPANGVDVVLMVDAYHEFDHPREMMEAIVKSLKPDGRVVLLEFRGEDPKVPIKPHHKMTVEQAKKEMAAVGLQLAENKTMLPWQHMMIFSKATSDEGAPGASLAFTSDDPLVQKCRALMARGEFKQAEKLLAAEQSNPAREEMKEIIRRTRREYSLDAPALLKKIQKDIPDATASDLDQWTKAGEATTRQIDGELKYFNREPSNIYRFSPEAKKRKEANAKKKEETKDWTLIKHLANVVAAGEKSDSPEVLPIRHRITYSITVPGGAKDAKAGSIVRCWLPFPQEYRQQKNIKLISASDGAQVAPTDAPQRTVYFEKTIEDPSKPIKFEEVIEYDSFAYYPKLSDDAVAKTQANIDPRYLSERPPHILFTPELKSTVKKIIGDETNPLAKVRKIYYWIDENIKYHAEEEYTVIPSFSVACLSRQKGDCGIQSILFITMCRAAGVPARWQSGWETKREDNTMHDWAEVYIEPWGWLPCDPSYGRQKKSKGSKELHDDPRVRDFYIGHQDSYRMIVNLDYGRELTPPKQSLRSEPADFQRGEVELDGRNLYFDEWDYQMKMEWLTAEQ